VLPGDTREIRGDTREIRGDTGRYGEIWEMRASRNHEEYSVKWSYRETPGRYGEIWEMRASRSHDWSYREIWGDTGRYGEMRGDMGDARLAKPRGVFGRGGAQLAARVIAA